MKRLSFRYTAVLTALGAVLLLWSAMQSDGGAPLTLVAPVAGVGVLLLLCGHLLPKKRPKKQEKQPAAVAAGCFHFVFNRPVSGSTWA